MELFLSNKDYYKCYKETLIADYDYQTIKALYQPIIGSNATILYFSLLNDINFQEWISISTFDTLSKKTGLSLLDITSSRAKLEAIGLLKTYRKEEENSLSSYIFVLYAPKTPSDFFSDPLFVGLLNASLGELEVSRLKRVYKFNPINLDGYYDVSASYKTVYDSTKYALIEDNDKIFGRTYGLINDSFDIKSFNIVFSDKYGFKKDLLKEKDLFEIERIAILFGLKEEVMASNVFNCFNSTLNSIDFDELYKLCRTSLIIPMDNENKHDPKEYDSDSLFAKKLNLMDQTAPYEYLRIISGYNNPAPSDVAILNDLSREYGLNKGVINAIIEYTLQVCNQDLPRPYCEKLAAKLKRQKIKNAMEAINALTNKKRKSNKEEKPTEEVINVVDDEITSDELKKMLEDL